MKKFTLSMLMLLAAVMGAQAKSWKIGPSSVAGMDFASINAAMEADEVAAGDTLYLDQYYNENQEQTVNKKVVVIGTGYDTSFTDEQVVAELTGNLALKTNDVIVKSVRLKSVYFYNDNCVIDRCYTTFVKVNSAAAGMNHIYSCYIYGRLEGYTESNCSRLEIQNCIVIDNSTANPAIHNIRNLTGSIINNSVITRSYSTTNDGARNCYCLANISNSVIANNIIYGFNSGHSNYYNRCMTSDVYASGSGNTIMHNVLSGSISNYPTNQMNWREKWSVIFVGSGSYSDYYKLTTESGENPAIGYATDGGDCGCHGGMFGCPSGGRPQYIPYFKKVTVGSRTEEGKLPVTLKIAIQSE